MPHRRAAWLTTPSHPFVLVCYGVLIYLGLIVLFGLHDPASMREAYGDTIVTAWALGRIAAGAIALAGAVGATVAMLRKVDPRDQLWCEFVGCCLIALVQGFYEWTLLSKFGLTSTMETQGLSAAFALAGLARAVSLPFQIRKWNRARGAAQIAPALAEPGRPER